eukprot:scaffold11495_cov30-Tisochrysis_lutea.AAC.1
MIYLSSFFFRDSDLSGGVSPDVVRSSSEIRDRRRDTIPRHGASATAEPYAYAKLSSRGISFTSPRRLPVKTTASSQRHYVDWL